MEILNLLNRQFGNKYEFLRVLKVEYNTLSSFTEITFIYPESVDDLQEEEKEEITNFIKNKLNLSCEIKIKYKKSFLNENLIKKHLLNYLKTVYSSMFAYFDEDNISVIKIDNNIQINIILIESIYEYFNKNNIKENILKELNKNFIGDFVIDFYLDESFELDDGLLDDRESEIYHNLPKTEKAVRYEVFEPEVMFGGDITPMPEMIKNQKDEKLAVILAGQISELQEKTYVSKRDKAKGKTDLSYYYKFNLADHTGTISAIYFSNKTTYKKARNLKDGDKVLIVGNIKKSQRDLSISIKSLSLCEIIDPENTVIENKEEEKLEHITVSEYKNVRPIQYMPLKQENIFDKKVEYSDYVMNNTFVVFDCETTGKYEDDRITEIGAAKIVGGKITEKFQVLINPEKEIPKDIIGITSITNEMVADCFLVKDVIKDFYKFCEGCILVGYNVSFDIGFITRAAKESGFLFDNEYYDAMVLAKQKLYLPRYRLINVVEALEIKLDNAHRAFFDALATAEVFLKLNEKNN